MQLGKVPPISADLAEPEHFLAITFALVRCSYIAMHPLQPFHDAFDKTTVRQTRCPAKEDVEAHGRMGEG